MKNIVFFVAVIALVFIFASSTSKSDKPFTSFHSLPSTSIDRDNFSQVCPGIIVIKVKAGRSLDCFSGSPASTGISSIDEKLARIQATGVLKRLQHKAIEPGSGKPDISRIYRVTFPDTYDPVEVAAMFKDDPAIEYAVAEPRMHLCVQPNDPMYAVQQHLPQVMADQAWEIHKGENGTTDIKIAIVDTGVDWYHEDLRSNIWQNLGEDANGDGHTVHYGINGAVMDNQDLNNVDDDGNGFVDDLIGWDFYEAALTGSGSDPDPDPNNDMGAHGSHCAGIACAATDNNTGVAGITWNLKYLPIQADINNDLTYGWDGIVYAADMGADIISNSWGGIEDTYNPFIADMIAYANASGSIILFAAGNDGFDCYFQPAGYPGAIAVGSVNGDNTKVSYSNYGLFVDVMAPGGGLEGGILSTVPGNSYERYFGTSMATPLTAGLMGLVKSYHPDWPNEQIIAQVIATCDNIDDINPLYADKLGSGRINAYQALVNTTAVPPQELKLEMLGYTLEDEDNDGKLMPDDSGTISISLRNYTHAVSSDAVTFTLTNPDNQVTIMNGTYVGTIDSDSIFTFSDMFQFSVSPGATLHSSLFTITISADLEVLVKEEFTVPVVIAPSGFFVYEKYPNGRDYSGTFIRQYLEDMGYEVTYSNNFPASLKGFEATFISLGNLVFPNWEPGTFLTEAMVQNIVVYLMSGGKMYLEGAGAFIFPQWYNYGNKENMQNAFGITNINSGDYNPIDTLEGMDGTLCEDMVFTHSTQYNNNYIEMIYPKTGAICPFEENDHGKVAVYNTGIFGQKTFYFAYSLADLKDINKTSCRWNLMNKIMESLGYDLPQDYLTANFTADAQVGNTSTAVTFKDISLKGTGPNINYWAWDFQNDGIMDSYVANPVFTYNQEGTYDVLHVVSNGTHTDTLIFKDFYTVQKGIFVYEGMEGARDMSGTYIKDFLEQNSYVVTYTNEIPRYLAGYDALFLSLGNISSFGSVLNNGLMHLLKDYMLKGGKIYLESGSAFGVDQMGEDNWSLFGLQNALNAGPFPVLIDTLAGKAGSICDGISFYSTNQLGQFFIDIYNANTTGISALELPGSGTVAVQHLGPNGEKTFCFSYALAELEDTTSTREDLVWAILNYFDLLTAINHEEPFDPLDVVIYPNPANARVTVSFELQDQGRVLMEVYDISGRLALRKDCGWLKKGDHDEFLGIDFPAGVYLLKVHAGDQMGIEKIVVPL